MRGRPRGSAAMTRTQRLLAGLPVCEVETCHRAPESSRGKPRRYCPPHGREHPSAREPMGPVAQWQGYFPVGLRDRIQAAARGDGVSMAEWVRRTLAKALDATPSSEESESRGP